MRRAVAVFLLAASHGLWSRMSCAQTDRPTIAFGATHAIALRNNGDVLTWGAQGACTLGRRASRNGEAPALIMRNAREIAAAVDHNLVLTTDGKVFGWGRNGEGVLGTGDTFDKCEGPVPVQPLADKVVAHIATGYGFSLAVTSSGDLYCTGDNSMGQCPVTKATRVDRFTLVPFPELSGKVAAVSAVMFHALVLTKDGTLFAFGRGRDGQLGNGKTANGFSQIPELTGVVSIAAGTWHSVAATADGSVWAWGNNSKSQLCDATMMNRASPTRVVLPGQAKVTRVAAGGHSTVLRASDALYACGDNQAGLLGLEAQAVVPLPTRIPVAVTPSSIFAMGGANAALASNCAVSLAGDNGSTIISATNNLTNRVFTARQNLSLCGSGSDKPLATIVNPAPSGGESGCWTPRVAENAAAKSKWAAQRQMVIAAEAILKQDAAFLAAPVPVRFRSTLGAGPNNDSGAQMQVKVVPERRPDGFRVWGTGPCEVIPQIDRIGGAIFQVSIFFNTDPRVNLIGASGEAPKLTGRVTGFPEYDNWVVITKGGRLPWIPQTLADKLDAEGARRRKVLEEWKRDRAVKSDAGTAEPEKQVKDYEAYRASFTPEQLRAPAAWADPTNEGKRKLDAQIASLQRLTVEEQRTVDSWGQESRALERQAQVEAVKNKNAADAARLRTQANDLANKVRALRQAHMDAASPLIADALAQYQLTNLKPGSAADAISVKPDPAFPDFTDLNRVQLITISFAGDTDPREAVRRAWQQKAKEAFDFTALAAMLK